MTPHPLRLLGLAAILLATGAAAQSPPPFAPGRADERVSMELALDDVHPVYDDGYVEIFSGETARIDDFQQGAAAGGGRLEMLPDAQLIFFYNGQSTIPLDDQGTRSFALGRGEPGSGPEYFSEYPYSRACPLIGVCEGYLEGPIESESEAHFDVVAGTLDGGAHVSTPNYGQDFFEEGGIFPDKYYSHVIVATSSVDLKDWVYVAGPGATATVTMTATFDVSMDTPSAASNIDPLSWITQAYGDVLAFNACDAYAPGSGQLLPTASQRTKFTFGMGIRDFQREEVCRYVGPEGEEEEVCTIEWVAGTASGSAHAAQESWSNVDWTDGPSAQLCNDDVPSETHDIVGSIPPSLSLPVEVPTNRWIEVQAGLDVSVSCSGAFACDLDAFTGNPATVSITSPNGTLVAWNGIAGLPVPEPESLPLAFAAFGVLAILRSRTRAPRLCAGASAMSASARQRHQD